jgi:hypothetical protein
MLNTLPPTEVLACAICGNRHENRTHVARKMMYGLRDEFRYLECGNCRCVHLNDIPQDMSKYYPENYYSFAPAGGLEAVIEDRWAAWLARRYRARAEELNRNAQVDLGCFELQT